MFQHGLRWEAIEFSFLTAGWIVFWKIFEGVLLKEKEFVWTVMLCILESPCVHTYWQIILSYRQTSFKAYKQTFNSLCTLSQGASLKNNNTMYGK